MMAKGREWRALRSIVDDAIEMLLSHLGPEARHLMSLMADILRGPAKPVYRSPTIPRQAQRWELQSQRDHINPAPAWQRCPQRHRYRERQQRWQGAEEHG